MGLGGVLRGGLDGAGRGADLMLRGIGNLWDMDGWMGMERHPVWMMAMAAAGDVGWTSVCWGLLPGSSLSGFAAIVVV